MRLIYNSDAQRLQKNFDDKTPVTVSELFRSERTASVPIELFLVDNDGGYATPGSSDYEVLIGRQAQAVTTGKLTLTFTGTTEEIDLSKPKLATRIEAALNAVSEVNAAGGVDVVELKNGRAFQITFRSVGSRAAITAGVKDSMQPASVLISEVTAGTGSTREVQLLTLEEASLAEVSTSGWSANSNPALTITTLVEGTANTREVIQLSVSNDPAPGSFFVVSNSEPISTEATAAQVKTILNSALSNDIGSVKKTGERIWQITYKTNGDKTALSAGTHNLVKRPSVNATLSLNTTALAYAANSDGSDLSVGFTLKKSNEVLLSENVDLAEPFAEVIGSSAMLNNDSLGALFTIAGDDVNKGTAISLSGGLTYSSDTLAAPFLPLAGGTMTGNILLGNDVKVRFGSEPNLEIYSTGSASYIKDIGTGSLYLSGGGSVYIESPAGETMAKFQGNGSVDLYYDNSKKFETTSIGATISGKLIVNGDLDVSGTTTTFNSTVVTVDDPVFTVGGDSAPVASDNKDRGIEFRYFRSGESAKVGFFGFDNSENAFTILTDATNNSEVFSGTLADLKCGGLTVDDITIDGSTISDSGALTISSGDDVIIDAQSDVNIDANGGDIRFKDDGTIIGQFQNSSNNFVIKSGQADKSIIFNTNGTEAARFDSSGNLKLLNNLTISSAYPRIFLTDTNNNSDYSIINDDGTFSVYDDTNASHLMRLNSTGLGIGGSPSRTLHVNSGALNITANFESTDSGAYVSFSDDSTTNDLSVRVGAAGDDYQLFTNGQERMRIDSSGNVGIGVNNPSDFNSEANNLVIGTGSGAEGMTIYGGSTGGSYIYFADGTSGSALYEGFIQYRHGDRAFRFGTATGVKMTLNSSGHLGIGTTSPSQMLEVAGDIFINGGAAGGRSLQLQRTGATNPWKLVQGHTATDYFEILEGSDTRLTIENGGNINIPDNAQFKFGDNGDTRIYSTNTLSIYDFYNYDGLFRSLTNDKSLIFQTTSGGAQNEIMRLGGSTSSINVPDDVNLIFGGSSDLKLYHSSSSNESFVQNVTGNFNVNNTSNGDDLILRQSNSSGTLENYIQLDGGGRLTRSYRNFRVQDGFKLQAGSSGLLDIYHDGNSKIEGTSGYTRVAATNGILYLDGNNTHIRSGDGGETQAKFIDDGAVELYYDGTKTFESINGGCQITGSLGIGSTPSVPLTVQGASGASSFKTGDGTRFFRVYQDAANISLTADGSVNLDTYVGGAKRFKIDTDGDIEQNYINYTDGSNYEALKISAESDHILFKTESIGTFSSNTRPFLFKTGANTKAQIDNLGIISYANLYISGTGSLRNTTNNLLLTTSSQSDNDIIFNPNDTEAVRITSTGRLGVGTSSPAYECDIQGAAGSLRVHSSAGGANIFLSSQSGNLSRIRWNGLADFAIRDDTDNADRFQINTDGDCEVCTNGKGLILNSANGTAYKITVANDGTVTSTAV